MTAVLFVYDGTDCYNDILFLLQLFTLYLPHNNVNTLTSQ